MGPPSGGPFREALRGVQGGSREEVRTEPSRRREFLSWVGGISGKPLLIVIIDAGGRKRIHGRPEFFPQITVVTVDIPVRINCLNFCPHLPAIFECRSLSLRGVPTLHRMREEWGTQIPVTVTMLL